MALRGVVAAETTSVLLTKHLRIVPCLRHRAPHHCGNLDPFRTIGQTSAGFLKPLGSHRFWKVHQHGAFPFHGKRLIYVTPIQVAITKHGFIWTSSIGPTGGSKHDVYDQTHFHQRTTCRLLIRDSKKTYKRGHERHSHSSKMCDYSRKVFSRCHTVTIRSLGSTLLSSPSDQMTRLSQRG